MADIAALLARMPHTEDVGRKGIETFMRLAGCSEEQIADHLKTLTRTEDPERSQTGGKLSQATLLVNMATDADFFHTPSGKAFATARINGCLETFPVRSMDFRCHLHRLYYAEMKRAAGAQAVQDAISVLEAKAKFDGPERQVHCRVAAHDGSVYLDLANAEREIVAITPSGWSIQTDVPVRFRRSKAMLALPTPVRGATLEAALKPFLTADENDFKLIVVWVFSTVQPFGAYPILQIKGEQGSAKSTTSRLLRMIIDPNEAPARAHPRDERDLVIALSNSHVGCFDNLSYVPDWLSDALCRVSTGQAFSTRTLHTDEDESIFAVKRPIIINGIEELATRGDLVDRSMIIDLPRIPKEKRKTEQEFWAAFDEAHPRILGALLDTAVSALARLDSIEVRELPRMSDFARWVIAAEPHLGWADGTLLSAYNRNKRDGELGALEASPVATAIDRFLSGKEWAGTATQLLEQLQGVVNITELRHPGWPKTAHRLGNEIRRLAPGLRTAGIDVQYWKSGNRIIRLERTGRTRTPVEMDDGGSSLQE
jgi:hypothetical protein